MSALRIHVGKLVDGTGAAPLEDAAVLIDGERIVALGPDASVPSPDSAERLDFGEPRLSISGPPDQPTTGRALAMLAANCESGHRISLSGHCRIGRAQARSA